MPDDRPKEVLGALPRTRPHRRSQKRAARPESALKATEAAKAGTSVKAGARRKPARTANGVAEAKPSPTTRVRRPRPERLRQPAQPPGAPKVARPVTRRSGPPTRTEIIGTAVQAAAELAEIGLSISARTVRGAVSRLPRP